MGEPKWVGVLTQGGGWRFEMGQNHKGSGRRESPAGSRGGAPVEGLGEEVAQKLKNF